MPRSHEGRPLSDQGSGRHSDSASGVRGTRAGLLAPWKVVLRCDDLNDADYIIGTIQALTPLNEREAMQRTGEAQNRGESLLLTTHRERAELYERQLGKRNLHVTIEQA